MFPFVRSPLICADKSWCNVQLSPSTPSRDVEGRYVATRALIPNPGNRHGRLVSFTPRQLFSNAECLGYQLNRRLGWADSQCFSTAGPRPGTGSWYQLYRAARGSPGICHFSFLSNFSRINVWYWKYSEEKNIREWVENLRPRCWPEETTICYKISLVQWLIINLNVILYLSTCHTVYISVLILL